MVKYCLHARNFETFVPLTNLSLFSKFLLYWLGSVSGHTTLDLRSFPNLYPTEKCSFPCILGVGGIGKSTALKHLARKWAEGSAPELTRFHFLFHVTLKEVRKRGDQSLPSLIIQQHKRLKDRAKNVQPEEIKAVLEGRTQQNALLLLDGFDEYKKGVCSDVDDVIAGDYLSKVTMLVSSRETSETPKLEENAALVAEITGFGAEAVQEYVTKYVGDAGRAAQLIEAAKKIRRSGDVAWWLYRRLDPSEYEKALVAASIARVPLLLDMICALFVRKVSLPETKTGIVDAIVQRCIQWDSVKTSETKRLKKDSDQVLVNLGKFVLEQWQKARVESFSEVNISNVVRQASLWFDCSAGQPNERNTSSFQWIRIGQVVLFFDSGGDRVGCGGRRAAARAADADGGRPGGGGTAGAVPLPPPPPARVHRRQVRRHSRQGKHAVEGCFSCLVGFRSNAFCVTWRN